MSTEEVDPGAILRGIADDEERVRRAMAPDGRLLNLVWAGAWILGYVAVFLAFVPLNRPVIPFWLGITVAAVVLAGAIAVSAVHSTRRAAGSRGPSMVVGAIYGNIYPVGFAVVGLLGWRMVSSGAPLEAMLAYWVAVPCLLIGALGVAGGALWNDRSQLVIGAWVLVVALVSLALAPPYNLLAGVVGGLGFLVLAAVETRRPDLVAGPIVRTRHG